MKDFPPKVPNYFEKSFRANWEARVSHTLRSASAQYVAARNYAHVWNDFRQSQEDCALQPRVARNELPSIAIGKNLPFARRFSAKRTLNIQNPTRMCLAGRDIALRCPRPRP